MRNTHQKNQSFDDFKDMFATIDCRTAKEKPVQKSKSDKFQAGKNRVNQMIKNLKDKFAVLTKKHAIQND